MGLRPPVAALFAIAVSAATAFAQSNSATLLGSVTDPTGAVIAGAGITVTNAKTRVARQSVTDAAGAYEIPLLSAGEYLIAVEHSGFKRIERSGIALSAGDKVKLDLRLEVGNVAEQITVAEAAPLLATQTPARGVTIASNQVENLPLNGRNFVQLISLQPGVVVGGQINGAITFNGLPYQGTTINIDGTDAANPDRPTATNFGGQTRLNLISQEFIQEFKTTQGVFTAEIGRATGGSVNVITKSGTNQFHGSLFEFVRNDKLDARNFFGVTKDKLRLNQFGATAGGPILRDKLFFFGGWEGSRERRGLLITGAVPTPGFRQQMLAANPAYKPILDLLPQPTEALPNDLNRGFHRRQDVRPSREDVFLGRIDFAPTARDTFFARYTIMDAFVVAPNIAPANGRTFPSQDRTGTFSWGHTLSPRTINELRLGANKQDLPRANAAYSPGGVGTISGFLETGSVEILQANGGSVTILDNFSHTRGKHSLKAGFEVRRYHYGRSNGQNPIYRFDTVQEILNSSPRSIDVTTAFPKTSRMSTTEVGVYFQDDFRVRSDLTLNLGLRWEYYTPVTEREGQLFNVASSPYGAFREKGQPIWDLDRNNFGPRFGLAWEMFGSRKNVIRLGGGVFYSENMLRNVSILNRPPDLPYTLTIDRADNPALARYPIDPFNIDLSKFQAPVNRLLVDPEHRTSYSVQWSFDYQREITPNLAVTLGYIGNRGLKFLQLNFLNQIVETGRRPVPGVGQIRYEVNDGMSVYHAFQTSVRKRYSHGVTFNTHYTFGKSITNGGGSEEGINDIQDWRDIRGSRSRTSLSIAHLFVADYGWDLPAGKLLGANPGRAVRRLLEGWRINGITTMRSGFPLEIQSGRDAFGSGSARGQRPYLVAGADIRAGTGDYRTSALHNYINRAAFVPNGRFQYGNLGGWILTGPGSQAFDFSIFKNTRITETTNLQFRTEMFNVFNHSNFSAPNSNLNSGLFGRITGAGAAREMQFGLKLLF
ncbi:MAG: TonB-dependent receptor [Acidobacteria bacterium]|nr:TonB-dependent receptor [Acidobacteriota bacterium]